MYKVMQRDEQGTEFCKEEFPAMAVAEQWIDDHAADYPESTFWIESALFSDIDDDVDYEEDDGLDY